MNNNNKFWKFCGAFTHNWEVTNKEMCFPTPLGTEERNTNHWVEAHNFYDVTIQCKTCGKVRVHTRVPELKEWRMKNE